MTVVSRFCMFSHIFRVRAVGRIPRVSAPSGGAPNGGFAGVRTGKGGKPRNTRVSQIIFSENTRIRLQ